MGVRYRRGTAVGDTAVMRELAELAFPGRLTMPIQARLRRLIDLGDRLGMTPGDAARLSSETLRALDTHGQLQPAIDEVLEAFDTGRLRTEVREPMNLYLDRSAVTALAVAVCETCRPTVAEAEFTAEPLDLKPEQTPVAPVNGSREKPPSRAAGIAVTASERQMGALWPERTRDGSPQMTLQVMVWWPGLSSWEPATLTAIVSQSLAFSGDNFTLLIEQEGDPEPARTHAVWMVKRDDLHEEMPVYELRASTWEMGDAAHEYRFLVASSSSWCHELHEYLATRWINKGLSPAGPVAFDTESFGGDQPPVGPFASRNGASKTGAGIRSV